MLEDQNIQRSMLEYIDEPKRSNSIHYSSDDKIIIDLDTKIVRPEGPTLDIF